ncbi:hypothetical protein QR412_05970 [Campylobacter jejuni]|nr:hypothetical protein QR412_05970 [Campylobacter jejuni]HEG0492408.1 hypothetical protein [Campylobacter jejuni]
MKKKYFLIGNMEHVQVIDSIQVIAKGVKWDRFISSCVFNTLKHIINSKHDLCFPQDKEKALFYIKAIIKESKNISKSPNFYNSEEIKKINFLLTNIAEKDKKLFYIVREILNENYVLTKELIEQYE